MTFKAFFPFSPHTLVLSASSLFSRGPTSLSSTRLAECAYCAGDTATLNATLAAVQSAACRVPDPLRTSPLHFLPRFLPLLMVFLLLCSAFRFLLQGLMTDYAVPILSSHYFLTEKAIAPSSVSLKHSMFEYFTAVFSHLYRSLARCRNTTLTGKSLDFNIFLYPVPSTELRFYQHLHVV